MGTATILSETLFGRTRGAVLAVLYGHIGESFYLRQLSFPAKPASPSAPSSVRSASYLTPAS